MNNEKLLMELMQKDKEDRKKYEKQLKEICNQSTRLDYDNLIERLLDITDHKININSYKFTSFLGWLCEDLEIAQFVNEKYYDLPIEEVDKALNTEIKNQKWKSDFSKGKGYDDFPFLTYEEYKNEMLYWTFKDTIDSIFTSLKREYEIKKNKV